MTNRTWPISQGLKNFFTKCFDCEDVEEGDGGRMQVVVPEIFVGRDLCEHEGFWEERKIEILGNEYKYNVLSEKLFNKDEDVFWKERIVEFYESDIDLKKNAFAFKNPKFFLELHNVFCLESEWAIKKIVEKERVAFIENDQENESCELEEEIDKNYLRLQIHPSIFNAPGITKRMRQSKSSPKVLKMKEEFLLPKDEIPKVKSEGAVNNYSTSFKDSGEIIECVKEYFEKIGDYEGFTPKFFTNLIASWSLIDKNLQLFKMFEEWKGIASEESKKTNRFAISVIERRINVLVNPIWRESMHE